MIDYYEPNIDLTLLGCGFLGSYHLGAIALLQQIWPHRPYNRICGASCGGLLGALLIVGLQLDHVLTNAMNIIKQLRGFFENPAQITSVRCLVERNLEKMLPSDAHKRCSNRLGLSITKLWSLENMFVQEYETRQELIDAIITGCYIPIWSGFSAVPKFKGQKCIDGAYSDNSPKFTLESDDIMAGVRQVGVTPFSGEVEVSPRGEWYIIKKQVMGTVYLLNWQNFARCCHAMFPIKTIKYKPYLIAGHRDMKDYVLRSNLIKCHKCCHIERGQQNEILENPISKSSARTRVEIEIDQVSCLSCLLILEKVDSLRVPQELIKIMEA